ncbi:E3 ubiquitin-protein ligase TRIM39-like [Leucoraja erinacea]|uniref:E3 ubiquitin-protein ligase TRIM39-like n=1 Tax=Leucoraja erinaceus TaxID=7782 RepID=UPI00245667DD|nr:E3 ubiquitin-protein ligase TRIM39-like [Leucoraja erinacea]
MEEQQKQKISQVREEAGHKRRISDDTHVLSLAERSYHPFWLNEVLGEPSVVINQVSVTLDVETAHPQLKVSEDRKRVRCTATWRTDPSTGKRFTYRACVLGSEGFTSGRHYWEVEVAGSHSWSLGVAAESVARNRRVDLTPETGFWCIRRYGGDGGDMFDALTSPRTRLPARPIPWKVGVYLSYESGTVSFYDADTKSHLHTFTGNKFTEKLYPFFNTWNVNQCLRICSGSAPGV